MIKIKVILQQLLQLLRDLRPRQFNNSRPVVESESFRLEVEFWNSCFHLMICTRHVNIRDDVKLAELVTARDCQSRGRRFDSRKKSIIKKLNLHGFDDDDCFYYFQK